MIKSVFITDSKKCLACGTFHSLDKQHCPECGRFLYSCGSVYHPKVVKNDIAPEFKSVLSRLPLPILVDMHNSYAKRISDKSNITAAEQLILLSFNDERARREQVML